MNHLPDRLRELREGQAMSRADLALASGVSERAIVGIEVGETLRPAYDTFLALARGLGVKAEELAAPADVPPVRRGRGRPRKASP